MTTPAARIDPSSELGALAQELENDARGSLASAAMHAAAAGHPKAGLALDLALEQEHLLDRITTAGLIPFGMDDTAEARRAWLDAAIDRIDRSTNPLLARYGDLHDRRHDFLAPRH